MKNLKSLLKIFAIFALLAALSPSMKAQQTSKTAECCSIVAQALDAVGRIKQNLTRADVEKDFTQEGGLFSREQTVYVFKLCPYIKIRVTFSLDPNYKGFSDGSQRDAVRSVSKPYIEYSVSD